MTAFEYQNILTPIMIQKFESLEVINEWRAFRGRNHQYSPRVNVAIGPFNIAPTSNKTEEYNQFFFTKNI